MQSVVIMGCGYTGLRLAQRCLSLGYAVRGTATQSMSLRKITACGAVAIRFDADGAHDSLAEMSGLSGDVIFWAIPPAPLGTRDTRLERWLERGRSGKPRRFVYLSTTGVYGDRGGAWVDEDTAPMPLTERAVRRVAAECLVRAWATANAVSWSILRIPGIYGPGRLPIERLRRGDPSIEPKEAHPSNRIHVEDLVTACVAAGFASRADGRLYNVTDGSDESSTEFLQRVARICGLPQPPLIGRREAELLMSPTAWSFLAESRRVSSRRIRGELGIRLAFEDLDEGIRASQ